MTHNFVSENLSAERGQEHRLGSRRVGDDITGQAAPTEQLPVQTGDGPCQVVDQALPVYPFVGDVLSGITQAMTWKMMLSNPM